jgi:hypothetical protein
MPEYQPIAEIRSTDPMVRAYLECAEWCGLEDADREALELAVSPTWDAASVKAAKEICAAFETEFEPFTETYRGEPYGCLPYEPAGFHLWLTRNRHGAGFWDGDWPEPFATKATEWAHAYGSAYVTFDEETETLSLWEE